MWQSLSRQAVGQPGTSRPPLPPPRAVANASPAQNVPTTPPTSQPALPASNTASHPPAYNPATHAPAPVPPPAAPGIAGAVQPSGAAPHDPNAVYALNGQSPLSLPPVHSNALQLNGAPAPQYGSPPQLSGGALPGAAPGDFSQRVLMDYLALVQSQLATMNQVVASTVAHNQALTAQNQALFEEIRALKQSVEGLTAAGPKPGAAAVAEAPGGAPPAPSAPAPAGAAAGLQPPSAAADTGAGAAVQVPGATAVAPGEGAPAVAAAAGPVYGTIPAAVPPAPAVGPAPSPAAAPAAAQPPSPSLVRPKPLPPPPATQPAPTQALQPPPAAAGAPPAPPAAAAAEGSRSEEEAVQLQLLSLLASELPSLTAAGPAPGADATAAASASAPAAAALPPAAASDAAPVPAAALGPRPPGRGGRYVGPLRADVFNRVAPGAAGPALDGAVRPAFQRGEAGAVAGARRSADGAGGAPRRGSFGAVPSFSGSGRRTPGEGRAPGLPGRLEADGSKSVVAGTGAGAAPGPAPAPAPEQAPVSAPAPASAPSSPVAASSQPNSTDATGAASGAGKPTATTAAAAAATESRIRLSRSAAELRAAVDTDRLPPHLAVLAAQQLPRIARLAAERQQEQQQQGLQGPEAPAAAAGGGKSAASAAVAAEAELLACRELFLRLVSRFSSPAALSALRPAFLPNYLALTAAAGELGQPPSRAFAGAVRQLVTQHVEEVGPELAAGGVAAVVQLDGTVAPGVLERACKVVTDAAAATAAGGGSGAALQQPLVGWKALVAAGQLAPLGRVAAEAARQVLNGAAAAATGAAAELPPDAAALLAAAQGVLACAAAGLAVPPVLLLPLEVASASAGALAAVGPSGQLLVAKAFVAAAHRPQDSWLDVWEGAVVASLSRAAPAQVAALAAAFHALARVGAGGGGAARPAFVTAVSERLLAAGPGAGVAGAGASACALALHLGELAAGGAADATGAADAVVPADATRLAAALLSVVKASLASLDLPDLAALVSGLSLLDVRSPPEVWSALLSRATDAPAAAAAAAAAARRALEVGLPAGIKPASLEHFLSVGGQHVGELPAASLVGLVGLTAAVNGKLRPGLLAAVMTRLYDQATALGPRDAAFLFAAVDSLALPLAQPLAARPLAVAGGDAGREEAGGDDASAAGLTPAVVLRRAAEAALVPERGLEALGLERTAQLLELIARLQQSSSASVAAAAQGDGGGAAAAAEVAGDADEGGRLVPRRQLLELLALMQPSLPEASPQALAAVVGSAAVLALAVPSDWLAAVVATALAAAPRLDPMTWSRIAAAVTRCERLAGVAPGTAGGDGGSWLDAFIDDMQRKLAAAPPAALALTLEVLVAHGRRPSAAWAGAFLAATTPSLEAPLPLTQAQAAGAAAVAASIAAGRAAARPMGRSGPAPPTPASRPRPAASPPPPALQGAQAMAGPVAAAFTPPQLAQLLGGLAALQLQQLVTPAWLAAAVRQVEGRAVHFAYRDLVEALYGIVRLGGGIRDAACNQLFIVSQAKLAAAPPALLARTLVVAAAAEGSKVSAKWWEEAQRVLTAKLSGAAAAGIGAGAGGWQIGDLCLAIESVLALHRHKDEAVIGPQLAAAVATVASYDAVAAALPADAAVAYVEACSEVPQLGRPPVVLLEHYLSYSAQLLAKFASDDSQVAALADELAAPSAETSGVAGKGGGGAREKRERKRARERAPKRAAGGGGGGGGAVPNPLLEHLQSAIAVGKMLVGLPEAERPAAAAPWLTALAAAGGAAAASAALPVSCAADVLWLIAKLEGSGAAAAAALKVGMEERWAAQLEALAARVGGAATAASTSTSTEATQQLRRALAPDAVVDTVWALQALGSAPGEGLAQALARVLPRRLASLPPGEALQLLKALADAGDAGVRAVAEADAAAAAAVPAAVRATEDDTAAAAAAAPKLLSTEVGRFLEAHMPSLTDNELVGALEVAARLELRLPLTVTSAAAARLAAAAAARTLHATSLYGSIQSLRMLRGSAAAAAGMAEPPLQPEQLDAFCEAAAEAASLGTLGGLLQIAQVAAALYDMGARPGPEWRAVMSGAVLEDVAGVDTVGGGVGRPPLTARSLISALYELARRYDANYVALAMAACQGAMEDLEGQLAFAEGRLVPEPIPGQTTVARMVPVLDPVQQPPPPPHHHQQQEEQQQQQQQEEDQEQQQQEEEEVLQLDPALLAPLELSDVVQLLEGLRHAAQEPPPALWDLLERALRGALRQGATAAATTTTTATATSTSGQAQEQAGGNAAVDAAAAAGVVVLEVNDKDLQALLVEMQLLRRYASEGLLQDLECYLARRMLLLDQHLLALFAAHCSAREHWPDPTFMRLFRQRVEELVPHTGTHPALLLLGFLFRYWGVVAMEAHGSEPAGDADRTQGQLKRLMQALLDCTTGEGLMTFRAPADGDVLNLVDLLTLVLTNLDLRLPHAASPERRGAWLIALQSLTYGGMGAMGLHQPATLLRQMNGAGVAPQSEWLAEYYRRLEAAAATAPPHELADAAMAVAAAGYQPALAPTLPARLAAALETRMREFALTDPRFMVRLLHAVGVMGHPVRTEVLQAVEVAVAKTLERASEVLADAAAAVEAEAEVAVEVDAAAVSAAEDVLAEETLLDICEALGRQAFRPGPQLADAIMGAGLQLHVGTEQLVSEAKERSRAGSSRQQRSGQQQQGPLWPRVAWTSLPCLARVLAALADWGVQPTAPWRDAAAAALAAVAELSAAGAEAKAVDDEMAVMMAAVAVLEQWGHQLSAAEVVALEEAVEVRLRICQKHDHPFDERLAQTLIDGLQDRLRRAVERTAGAGGSGAAAAAAAAAPPAQGQVRRAAAAGSVVRRSRDAGAASSDFSGMGFGGAGATLGAFGGAAAARPGVQQGPVAEADYRDLDAVLQGISGRPAGGRAADAAREESGGAPSGGPQGAGAAAAAAPDAGGRGPMVDAAEAAEAIAEAVRAAAAAPDVGAAAVAGPTEPVAAAVASAAAAAPPPAAVEPAQSEARQGAVPSAAAEQVAAAAVSESAAAAAAPTAAADVEAPSTRVPFRRLPPGERAAGGPGGAAARRAAPVAPSTSGGSAAANERTRAAISQLLQLVPQSSRPPARASKVSPQAAEAAGHDGGDNGCNNGNGNGGEEDDGSGAAAQNLQADRLRRAAAATTSGSAAAARKPSFVIGKTAGSSSSSSSGSSGSSSSGAGIKVRSWGLGRTGQAQKAGGGSAAAAKPGRRAARDPQDPSTWNLLDRTPTAAPAGSRAAAAAAPPPPPPPPPPKAGSLPVVEPEVLEP